MKKILNKFSFLISILFLNNKIKFTDISKKMHNILNLKEYKKFKMLKVNKINDVMDLNKKISLKVGLQINK